MEPKNEALEIWRLHLSSGQRDALRLAYQGQNIRRGVSNIPGELHWKSYDKITRMKLLSGGRITDKGRAVYEASLPADATPQASQEAAGYDAYDYSVMTAAELLDVARQAWRDYDLNEVVSEYADMGASVMMDLAMNATPQASQEPDDERRIIKQWLREDADALAIAEARVAALEAALRKSANGFKAIRGYVYDSAKIVDPELADFLEALNEIDEMAALALEKIAREALNGAGQGGE